MELPCFPRQTIWQTLKKADSQSLNSEMVKQSSRRRRVAPVHFATDSCRLFSCCIAASAHRTCSEPRSVLRNAHLGWNRVTSEITNLNEAAVRRTRSRVADRAVVALI